MRYLAIIGGILLAGCASNSGSLHTASTSPASTSAASVQIQENDAVRLAIKTGYHAQSMDGEKRYCRERNLTGSHFVEMACYTPDQLVRLMAVQIQVHDMLDIPLTCSGGFMCNWRGPGKDGK